MKNAAKKWWNYLIILAIVGIIFISGYLPFKNLSDEVWPFNYMVYFFIFAGIAVALIGFIAQDIYRGVIRHRINDWDNNLDKSYLDKAWLIFFPLLFSGLIVFISGIVMNIFFL